MSLFILSSLLIGTKNNFEHNYLDHVISDILIQIISLFCVGCKILLLLYLWLKYIITWLKLCHFIEPRWAKWPLKRETRSAFCLQWIFRQQRPGVLWNSLPGSGWCTCGKTEAGERRMVASGTHLSRWGERGEMWVFLKMLSDKSLSLSPSFPTGPLCPWWGLWPVAHRKTCPSGSFVPLPFLWTFESDGKTLLPGTV